MMNTFTWVDLSTFDIDTARDFYQLCFGWRYQEIEQGYLVSSSHGGSSTGLFKMPEELEKIGMPSFWMSYVHVDDLDAKVRVEPTQVPGGPEPAVAAADDRDITLDVARERWTATGKRGEPVEPECSGRGPAHGAGFSSGHVAEASTVGADLRMAARYQQGGSMAACPPIRIVADAGADD